ncbi:MAG: 50S ribosomal protein L10 [Alphaproteobacteria bacterium]|nr:50S ribosomal protein L10 [Alphaproteobacteria bacterium]
MAKNRAFKQQWIDDTNAQVKDAGILLIAHYKGLTVAEITDLRIKIRAAGASFKVTKNLLVKRALTGTHYENISHLFKGPTAVAYSSDPTSAAKALNEFAKKNGKLVLVGGAFGNTVLDKAAIQQLAELPSLDELRAKIIAMLQTPATRIAGVLQAPAGQLARVFGAYATKGA